MKYSTKTWLNPVDSYATSYIACYDGSVKDGGSEYNTKFISIADCRKALRIYKTEEDTVENYINKLSLIRDDLDKYIEHLKKQQ